VNKDRIEWLLEETFKPAPVVMEDFADEGTVQMGTCQVKIRMRDPSHVKVFFKIKDAVLWSSSINEDDPNKMVKKIRASLLEARNLFIKMHDDLESFVTRWPREAPERKFSISALEKDEEIEAGKVTVYSEKEDAEADAFLEQMIGKEMVDEDESWRKDAENQKEMPDESFDEKIRRDLLDSLMND